MQNHLNSSAQPGRKLRTAIMLCMKLCLLASLVIALPSMAERLKDLASIQGVRDNPLIGYGLMVGLDGSGDQTMQTPFTTQSLNNMLGQLGVTVPAGTNMQLRNVASVMSRPRCRRLRGPARPSTSLCRRWAMPKACAVARCS